MSTPSPWEHFSVEELSCRCGCGEMKMNADFMDKAVKLRKFYGKALIVTSGYRCPAHDEQVGTSYHPGSGPHVEGRALDFSIEGADALSLIKQALQLGLFTGFGLAQKGADRFMHIDDLEDRPEHPRPFVWTY